MKEDLHEREREREREYGDNNVSYFFSRCHEAGGVTVLAAIREHAHIVLWNRRTSINADVSITRVHRARERTGKSRRPLNRTILLPLSSTMHDPFHLCKRGYTQLGICVPSIRCLLITRVFGFFGNFLRA